MDNNILSRLTTLRPNLPWFRGRGNSIMVSIMVTCLSSGPSKFEPGKIHLFQKGGILSACYEPVSTSADNGSPKAVHVLSCLCDNARKSRASCPVSRFLSGPIWPVCVEQGHLYDTNKQ